jgi:hypothetical protein
LKLEPGTKMATKKSSKKPAANKKTAASTAKVSQPEGQAPEQNQAQIVEPASTKYQDGLAGLSLYQGVLKMDFYKVLGLNPDGTEVRKISDRVVMPATKLAELEQSLQQIIAAIQNAQQQG